MQECKGQINTVQHFLLTMLQYLFTPLSFALPAFV